MAFHMRPLGQTQAVIDAMAAGNKACSACHGAEAAHHSLHDAAAGQSVCDTCHNPNLENEHVVGRSLTCMSCHQVATLASTSSGFGQKLCSDCHSTSVAHDLSMATSIPAAIPTHPGLTFAAPLPIALFEGESWVPSEAEAGQVAISSRSNALTPDQLWHWYSDAMAGAGWTLISEAPNSGGVKWDARYIKGQRRAAVLCYSGDRWQDQTSSVAGARIRVAWWSD
jgi:hypothetical protein